VIEGEGRAGEMSDGQPYAEAAWLYRRAGWTGVLPLGGRSKYPPPPGFTGWAGAMPSGADVQAWTEGAHGAGNIALRLPLGVYGLDVDAYEGKAGAAALAELEAAHGPLPATWTVTSRSDAVSGIRLFRAGLPAGRRWRDEPAGHGRGIEAIHFGHRYAVVWPSVHPNGHKYAWWRPSPVPGAAPVLAGDNEVPRPDELPVLPAAWVEALSEPGEVREGSQAGHAETLDVVRGWREGDPCPPVAAAESEGFRRLRDATDGAALHPAGRDATYELACLGHEGHAGVRAALARHYSAFVEVRAGRGGGSRASAEGEWWRLVRGAVGKLVPSAARERCDCDLWAGAGVQFDPGPLTGPLGPASATEEATTFDIGALPPPVMIDSGQALLEELLSGDQLAARAAPVPLVAGLLYRDTLAWLIGKSGSFKSFVAFDIAQHVAGGQPWAGRRTERGDVVYVMAEGQGGASLRARAWRERNGPLPGGVHYLTRPVQAASPEQWGALLVAMERMRPSLIILDTQARNTLGIKENDNTDMGRFVEQVDRLRRVSDGACVLVIHHIGRAGDDARGASAIDGAQDTELKLTRDGRRAMHATLSIDKQKDAPDTASVDLRLDPVELGPGPTGEPLSSLVVCTSVFQSATVRPWLEGLPGRQAQIVEIINELFSEAGGSRAEVIGALRERGGAGPDGYNRNAFGAAWNSLLRKDLIERVAGTQRYVTAGDPPAGGDVAPAGNPFAPPGASGAPEVDQ
jgi:hypothetical protein